MISTHVYLYNNFFNDVNIHLSKGKKPKHLKLTNLWNYLTNMKQKIKSFENEIIQRIWSNNDFTCIVVSNVILEIHIWDFLFSKINF
jgi:hypothetical protein